MLSKLQCLLTRFYEISEISLDERQEYNEMLLSEISI